MNPKLAGIYKTFLVTQLVLESIKESGGGPSSYIYLALQNVNVGLLDYQRLLAILKKEKAVIVKSHYVTAGPKLDEVLERMTSMVNKVRAKISEQATELVQNELMGTDEEALEENE